MPVMCDIGSSDSSILRWIWRVSAPVLPLQASCQRTVILHDDPARLSMAASTRRAEREGSTRSLCREASEDELDDPNEDAHALLSGWETPTAWGYCMAVSMYCLDVWNLYNGWSKQNLVLVKRCVQKNCWKLHRFVGSVWQERSGLMHNHMLKWSFTNWNCRRCTFR